MMFPRIRLAFLSEFEFGGDFFGPALESGVDRFDVDAGAVGSVAASMAEGAVGAERVPAGLGGDDPAGVGYDQVIVVFVVGVGVLGEGGVAGGRWSGHCGLGLGGFVCDDGDDDGGVGGVMR